MREVKYKAWLKYKKEMVNVTSIDLKKGCVFIDKPYFPKIPEFYGTALLFHQIELLEYIGKSDVHDVDIYVGNIVRVHYEYESYDGYIEGSTLCVVKYIDEWCRFIFEYLNDNDGNYYSIEDLDMNDVEVIGNIYENPELLEVK